MDDQAGHHHPRPDLESDPDAVTLWDETGKFIGAALARMERGKAFSIMLARIQHELKEAYGAENARKVMQAMMDTMEWGQPPPSMRVPCLPQSPSR